RTLVSGAGEPMRSWIVWLVGAKVPTRRHRVLKDAASLRTPRGRVGTSVPHTQQLGTSSPDSGVITRLRRHHSNRTKRSLSPPRPRPHLELSFQPPHRAPPHVHPELPGLDDELHALIVQPELFGRQRELHGARFSGLQGHPPEARERTHRSGDGPYPVVDVQLRHL